MSPEMAVIELMSKYEIDVDEFHEIISERGLDVNFSRVRYTAVAPYVDLDPIASFHDASLFDLQRSRIPTPVFRTIVEDMDIMMLQYGPLDHESEQATSRTLAPIFNRLVAVFESAITNDPEPIRLGRHSAEGIIEYRFKTFGAIAVLLVDVNRRVTSDTQRLDAIAQVIAECGACHWTNVGYKIHVPIHAIICDTIGFSFFKFDGDTSPYTFSGGHYPGGLSCGYSNICLFPAIHDRRRFLAQLRILTEIVFDVLLAAYCRSLVVFRDRPDITTGQKKNLDSWATAIDHADDALAMCRNAELERQAHLPDEADAMVDEAFQDIHTSLKIVPMNFKLNRLMNYWSDEVLRAS
ncbi:hypothetical protein BD410DRAFT_901961 [Rickenella mellea]|uniref:Uncharacterized protein n=1 Tax=Rickenella mellea TaxID=50990 RepID=A0A4Y7PMC5_9AGAM|nr:hypothetical protein BD410DRAFT_901961 [Rickenella mellea]